MKVCSGDFSNAVINKEYPRSTLLLLSGDIKIFLMVFKCLVVFAQLEMSVANEAIQVSNHLIAVG